MSLTDNEKANIVYSHIKNIEAQKYNVEISMLAENASPVPNESYITDLNNRKSILEGQITALQEELSTLEYTIDPATMYTEISSSVAPPQNGN